MIGRDPNFRVQYEHGAQESDDVARLLAGIEPAGEIPPQRAPAAAPRQKIDLPTSFGPMVKLR